MDYLAAGIGEETFFFSCNMTEDNVTDYRIQMTGPAQKVYEGVYDDED